MSHFFLIHSLIFIPLLTAAVVLLTHNRENLRDSCSLIGGIALASVSLILLGQSDFEVSNRITWAEPLPGITLAFHLEPLGLLFILVASILWPITTLYAVGYMRGHREPRQTSFFAFFAIAIACTMAIALSANLFTLFVFYELLTLSTYPLVTHKQNEEAQKAGRIYLYYLLGTAATFFLPAIALTWLITGSQDFTPGGILNAADDWRYSLLLVLFVFGVGKSAIMPFHRWLPAAMVAPTPVSALLHAVAVVKAGAFSILKIMAYIFGLDVLQELDAADWLAYLASFTLVIASFVALRADNLKRRLAFSTISQLNYITLAALLANSAAFMGGGMHIAMHAFAKITLFFCAGAVYVIADKTKVSELDGLGSKMPLTVIAFFIASLGIIGIPPTGGTWSKWYLLMGTAEAGQWLPMACLMLSTLLSMVYLLSIPVRSFLNIPSGERIEMEAVSPMIFAICLCALGTIGLFVLPDVLFDLISQIGGLSSAGDANGR